MITFRISHDNSQGVLLRVLGAVSRRALSFYLVHAEHNVIELELEVNKKTHGQLLREWHSIVGVKGVQTWKTYRWE